MPIDTICSLCERPAHGLLCERCIAVYAQKAKGFKPYLEIVRDNRKKRAPIRAGKKVRR